MSKFNELVGQNNQLTEKGRSKFFPIAKVMDMVITPQDCQEMTETEIRALGIIAVGMVQNFISNKRQKKEIKVQIEIMDADYDHSRPSVSKVK